MGAELRNPAIDEVVLSAFFADFGKLMQKAVTAPRPDYQFDKNQLTQFFCDFSRFYKDRLRSGMMIDPWAIAGLGRDEVRNSAVLAWLFDENGSHGMEGAFLRAFLLQISPNDKSLIPDAVIEKYRIHTEKYSFGDKRNRIDLMIEGDAFILFIEVKIDAGEGVDQIKRYWDILQERVSLTSRNIGKKGTTPSLKPHALIYLTSTGEMPNLEGDNAEVFAARWSDVAQSIKTVISQSDKSSESISKFLLDRLASRFSNF